MKSGSSTRRYSQRARARSTEATGQRIVDAFVARLMEQWYDEITLDRVAEDAGVTVQTVVRRFGGKKGLLAKAWKHLGAQIITRRTAPPGDIDQLVDKLIEDYEITGDAVIRLLALEERHPAVEELLNFGRSEHRRWVSSGFVESPGKVDAISRRRAVDALVIATDVYTWKLLRRDMGRSVAATAATMKRLVQAVLAEFSIPLHPGDAP